MRRALRRERVFRDRTNPLDIYDDRELHKRYRFTRDGCTRIIDLLTEDLETPTRRNHSVPGSLQVFIALSFYGQGALFSNTATIHGVSIPTASRVIRRVTLALIRRRNTVSKRYPGNQVLGQGLIMLKSPIAAAASRVGRLSPYLGLVYPFYLACVQCRPRLDLDLVQIKIQSSCPRIQVSNGFLSSRPSQSYSSLVLSYQTLDVDPTLISLRQESLKKNHDENLF